MHELYLVSSPSPPPPSILWDGRSNSNFQHTSLGGESADTVSFTLRKAGATTAKLTPVYFAQFQRSDSSFCSHITNIAITAATTSQKHMDDWIHDDRLRSSSSFTRRIMRRDDTSTQRRHFKQLNENETCQQKQDARRRAATILKTIVDINIKMMSIIIPIISSASCSPSAHAHVAPCHCRIVGMPPPVVKVESSRWKCNVVRHPRRHSYCPRCSITRSLTFVT